MERLKPEEFLEQGNDYPIIDVRTPAEFEQGHIPGAFNIPIFSNEERVIIGTLYKKKGKEEAVEKGLEFVGPKMAGFVRKAKKLAGNKKRILVHCWRGGMRSGSMAWLFETAGLEVAVLAGGYKAYRNLVLSEIDKPRRYVILSGMTGTGKTELLHVLHENGSQIIDLEGLANHKGSAFGAIGEDPQPTTEQFANNLYVVMSALDPDKPTWIEDECRSIGRVFVPDELYVKMKIAPRVLILLSREVRIRRLVQDYGGFPIEELKASIEKIKKRLGGLKTKEALAALDENDLSVAADISLAYYDKAYTYDLTLCEEDNVRKLPLEDDDFQKWLPKIVEMGAEVCTRRIENL